MEELNPEFSICNQNVEPSTTYPLIMFLAVTSLTREAKALRIY